MKLTTLNPTWLKVTTVAGRPVYGATTERIEANAIRFDCPRCKTEDPDHQHTVTILTPVLPPQLQPGPGRWELIGPTFDTLTLKGANGKTDSVWFQGGCGAHFFVRNGDITFA